MSVGLELIIMELEWTFWLPLMARAGKMLDWIKQTMLFCVMSQCCSHAHSQSGTSQDKLDAAGR